MKPLHWIGLWIGFQDLEFINLGHLTKFFHDQVVELQPVVHPDAVWETESTPILIQSFGDILSRFTQ